MSNQRPIRQRVRTAADQARRDLYLWSKALQSSENTYLTRDSLLKRGGPLPDVLFHLSLEDIKRIEDETALRLIRWSEDFDGHEVPAALAQELLEPIDEDAFFTELDDVVVPPLTTTTSSLDEHPVDLIGSTQEARSSRGRKPSNAWPQFAAELAIYVHDNGLPGTQAELMEAMLQVMENRGQPMGRSTIQPAITCVFRRLGGGQ